MPTNKDHLKYLLLAQKYSTNSLGITYPNPSVGCVIVDYSIQKNGKIISFGVTGDSGRPHAEEIALKKIKNISLNTFIYLTLEPCFHKSQTSSCVNQIIKSGIKNVFIASSDPDSRTNYKSIKKLKKNNINVNLGLTKELTCLYNRFFYFNKKFKRSYVSYKIAVSSDLKIAESNYNSKWISNYYSRRYSQHLRFKRDAILTTYSTIKYDNPRFTLRLNQYPKFKNNIIILDSKLQINLKCKIVRSAIKRRVIIFTMSNNKKKILNLKRINCEIISIQKKYRYFNLKNILKKTYTLGICSILVEAGGILFTSMYNLKLINELHLFKATKKIGKKGIPMYLGFNNLSFKNSLIEKKCFKKDRYYHYNI